ncbi:MAG: ADP-ribosylglycohydrolase family protein [Clostridia bacterium]|nr:ADP-ribosylglycohydrolase family protein [Clostridia bacterium]
MTKLRGMVLGSFVADALSLGPHWVYNIEDIKEKLGIIQGLTAPITHYHQTKEKGDFTHYGDYALMIFQYIKVNQELEKKTFYKNFKAYYDHYNGYMDHATKVTLEQLSRGTMLGSHSSELGGMIGFAPIIYLNHNHMDEGVSEVLRCTEWTHDDPKLLERTKFLALLTYEVLKGAKPSEAIDLLEKEISNNLFNEIRAVKNLLNEMPETIIKKLGQGCDSGYAFPAALYFILRFEDDFKKALLQNVMCGGDSAARGMVIGAVLGAYHGESEIPVDWLASMKHFKEIENLMM